MNIGFDLDGVLYPWHIAVYNELVIYWNLKQDFHSFWSEGFKTYKNEMFWHNLCRMEHLISNQVPNRKDVVFLKDLSTRNNIYYVTNRPVEIKLATVNWLRRYEFPCAENLIFTDDKAKVVQDLGINVFVEDRVENIERLLGICELFVVKQPHNEAYINHAYKQGSKRLINHVYEMEGLL